MFEILYVLHNSPNLEKFKAGPDLRICVTIQLLTITFE